MALNDSLIRAAKPLGKPYKLYDQDALFLLVTTSGNKLWRLKYRLKGKEQLCSWHVSRDRLEAGARATGRGGQNYFRKSGYA